MEEINQNDRIKISLMKKLYSKSDLSPTALANSVGCKYETAKKGLFFLEKIGLVDKKIDRHEKRNHEYFYLTERGRSVVKNLSE